MRPSGGFSLRKRVSFVVLAGLGLALAQAPDPAAAARPADPAGPPAAVRPAAAAAPAGPRDFFYDAAGQLVATSTGTEVAVNRYDDAGNLLRTERIPASRTSIFALVPARGPVGTTVEIQGTGFSTTASANTVTIDGISAPVTTATANRLTIKVPDGATEGVVRVTVNGETATSPRPFLLAAGITAPTITSISTDRGNRNEVVTITGTGFDPVAARNVVMFHRTVARVQTASATQLSVRVPDAATSGRITVRTPGGSATSASDFLIAPRGFVMRDLVYAGTLAKNGAAVTATIPAGKSALLLVDGTAGERLNIRSSNNTIPVRSALWMYTPYGGNFGRGSLGDPIDIWAGAPLSQDLPAMPATGKYALVIKPNDGAAGSVGLAVSTTLAGPNLTKNGAGVPFQVTTAQQVKEFPFTAAANEWLSLGLTELSEPSNRFVVKITAPDGTSQSWDYALAQYIPTMVYKAKAAGTYRLGVTFGPGELGFGKVWLSSVINGPTLGVNGAEAAMRIERPGQSVRLPFSGTTGQNLQLGYSENLLQQNDRPYYPGVLLIEPDEVQREITGGWAEARSLPTLRKTGTHYLLVTGWQAVGTVKAWLSTAIEAGALAANGRASVTIDRPGRDAYFDFNGTAGRPISGGTINNSIPGEVTLRLYRPNGSVVSLGSGRSFDVASLPDTGRYRLQIDPESPGTGKVNVYLAEPIDLGLMSPDTAIPAPVNLPGQKVVGRFAGQVGQRLSLGTRTPMANLGVRVYRPDGTTLTSSTIDTRFGLDLPALTVAGEYRVEITTINRETGDLTVYLNTEVDAGGFTVDGPNKTITIARPAQNARMTFTANAADRVDLNIVTLGLEGGTAFYYTLIGPDGRTLANHWWPVRLREQLPTLTATGVHTLILDPGTGATGTIELGLKYRTSPAAAAPKAGKPPTEPTPATPVCDTEPESRPGLTAPAPGRAATAPQTAPRASQCQRDAGWTPDARNLSGDWTTGEKTAPARGRPLQFAVGVTGVVGKVLNTAGKPLPKVTVSAAGKKTTTDDKGRFALADLPGGHVALRVDGRPAGRYGVFDIGVDLNRGQVLVLPHTVFLPEIDPDDVVTVRSPTTREVVLTTKAIPGLEVRIPAGTVIRDSDGEVATTLSLTPVPIDRPPFPLPPTKVPVYFSAQPGSGVLFPEGARIIYPNYTREAPGTRTHFWNYDPDGRGWHIYGYGTVSKDGKQIVPDANVKFYRLTGAMTAVPGMTPPPLAPRANGMRLGDPVDPATGLLVDEAVDLVVDDIMPIQIKRTYQQGDPDTRTFGVGMNFDYGMFPWSPGTIGNFDFSQFDLIQPDGSKIHYQRTSPGTDYAGAIFKADPTPTAYDGSEVRWNGDGWDVVLRDGTIIVLGDEAPMQAIRDKYGNTTTITRATAAPGTDGKVRQNGAITQITSPSGRWVRFSYDANNPPRVASIEDNLGRRVSYAYDATGHLSTVTNPDNGVTRYTWNAQGRLETITDPRNIRFLRNEYDDQGRIKLQEAADGGLTKFEYVAAGSVITETKMTDARNHVRRLTFNDKGQVVTDTRAFGTDKAQATTYEYDASGSRVAAEVDALNRRTTYVYDARGQVKERTLLAGTAEARTEKFERNGPYGELTKHTDLFAKDTIYERDTRGALKSVTDPMVRKTVFEVNGSGLTTSVTDPALKKTTIDYAGADPVKVTDPLGRVDRAGFDPLGRRVWAADPRGAETETTYTSDNQVRSIVDPLGRVTEFGYDANGNLETVTDPRKGVTRHEFDTMDRVKTITDPVGASESVEYDLNGNLARHTSRRGIVTEHDYDQLDRRMATRYGTESTVAYGYDAASRLRRTEDSVAGVTAVDFDGLDRVTKEATPTGEVSYAYGASVRDRTMTVTGSPVIRHVYNANGELSEIQRGGTQVTLVGRDSVGRPNRVGAPGTGVHQTYTYDDAGQVKTITYRAGTTVLGDLAYDYNPAGQPVRTTGTWSRTQLPAAFGPATYDAASRLKTIGDTPISYDPDGNLTSDGQTSYTWNARGQLSGLSREGLSASFGYATDGRRAGRTVNDATVNYLYDGANPVQEKAGGAIRATMTATGLDGWQLRESGGVTRQYLSDAVGSTLGLVNSTGAGASYAYDPFGGTEVTGDDGGNPYRYTGREDDGTGLYYYRARYYSPTLQRFISEDPIGFAGGINLYTYVENSPTTLTDPDGEKPKSAYIDGPLPDYGQTSLYARYNPVTGEIYKWGISKNPVGRYPKDDYLDGSRMQIIKNYDSRQDATTVERYLTERWPGPQNHEPWAGSVPTNRPWTGGIEDVRRGVPLR